MTEAHTRERLALLVLWGVIAYCWLGLLTPASAPLDYLLSPAYCAMVAATLSTALYSAIHVFAPVSDASRRRLLALFLAGMPFVYLWSAGRGGDAQAVILESLGAAVFVPTAVLGYRRSLLVLGGGIAAHGIAWDLWHHHRATYIEPWYPLGCLLVDVALFLVVLAYASEHSRAASRATFIDEHRTDARQC